MSSWTLGAGRGLGGCRVPHGTGASLLGQGPHMGSAMKQGLPYGVLYRIRLPYSILPYRPGLFLWGSTGN